MGTLADSTITQRDSDSTSALNVLAGIRAFVTPYIAVFAEYKYTTAAMHFGQAFGDMGGLAADYRAQHVVFGVSYHF